MATTGQGETMASLTPSKVPLWDGGICLMCSGSGVARMTPASGLPYYVRCPACNGHGYEPGEEPDEPAPSLG